jgi:hypothetical protein
MIVAERESPEGEPEIPVKRTDLLLVGTPSLAYLESLPRLGCHAVPPPENADSPAVIVPHVFPRSSALGVAAF